MINLRLIGAGEATGKGVSQFTGFPDHATFRGWGGNNGKSDKLGGFLSLTLCDPFDHYAACWFPLTTCLSWPD